MTNRKVPLKAAKSSLHGKAVGKIGKKRPGTSSGKSSKVVAKDKAKLLLKSATKILATKSNKRTKPLIKLITSAQRCTKLKGRPSAKLSSKNQTKSPGRPAAKSPIQKPARSPRSSPTKSPLRKSAKANGKPAISPGRKGNKSPGRPAKSPGRPVKSPGRPAKSLARPAVKSPGRPPVKSPGRPPVKSPGRAPAKSFGRPAMKSPGRPVKSPGRPPIKSPGRPPLKSPVQMVTNSPRLHVTKISPNKSGKLANAGRKTVKSPLRKSPVSIGKLPGRQITNSPLTPTTRSPGRPRKSVPGMTPSTPHNMLTVMAVKKKSPPGCVPIKILDKVKSPVRTMKTSPKSASPEVRSSPRVVNHDLLSSKPIRAEKITSVNIKTVIVKSSPTKVNLLSNSKKPMIVPQTIMAAKFSPRKQMTAVHSTVKENSSPKIPFTSPPRPTRVISPPARLLETDMRQYVKKIEPDKRKGSPKSSLDSPSKVKKTNVSSEKKQSRSETRKGVESDGRSTRSGGVTSKQKVPKLSRTPDKEEPNKTKETPKKETLSKYSPKGGGQKTIEKAVSPKSASHPCKHCNLMFRTRSDGELHEHRCNKNPGRTDTRYPCNKCSGTFTMSDLILHKKQAHPQRSQSIEAPETAQVSDVPAETPSEPLQSPAATAVTPKTKNENISKTKNVKFIENIERAQAIKTSSGGLVLKVPIGGDLNEVIRQAVQAAKSAGFIPANKKILIRQQKKSSKKVNEPADKQKTKLQAASTLKRKCQDNTTNKNNPTSIKRVRFEKLPIHVDEPAQQVKPQKEKRVTHVPNEAMQDEDSKTTQPKFFTCLDCGEIFPSRNKVSAHKGDCLGMGKSVVHACMDCNTTYMGRTELNDHRREKHSAFKRATKSANVTIRSFKCSQCELFFPIESETKKHISEIHAGVGVSSMCNVVATPDIPQGDNWNRNISEQMVEDVIEKMVNGARDGKESKSDGGNKNTSNSVTTTLATKAVETPNCVKAPTGKQTCTETHISAESVPLEKDVQEDGNISEATTDSLNSQGLNKEHNVERKPGQCLDCFIKVSSRLELAKHKRHCKIAIQNRQLFCFVCSSSFRSYFELSRHKQEQHTGNPQNVKCMPCKTVFKTQCALLEHQNKKHPTTPVRHEPNTPEKVQDDNSRRKQQDQTLAKKKSLESLANKEQNKISENLKEVQIETIKDSEPIPDFEVRTRSGRVVHKKRLGDELTPDQIERARKVKQILQYSNPIGTIEIVPVIEVSDEEESDDEKEKPQPDIASKPLPMTQEIKAHQSNLSFANGLVTISAEKANNYEIFFDEMEDGSTIQLKLVRKEDCTKESSQSCVESKPKKTIKMQPTAPITPKPIIENKANADISEVQRTTTLAMVKKSPTSSETKPVATNQSVILPAANKIPKVNYEIEEISEIPMSPNKDEAVDEGPNTANPPVDTAGKVVQKGKPFVIGGQTLVPIQFPPGFKLPGGATGGQKVFAIPSTNLPPGLLQLLAKQQRASTAATSLPSKAAPPKKIAPKINPTSGVPKKRAGTMTSQSKNVDLPASLKGMTGAQLMARAQARILGRPLPPLAVEVAAAQAAAAQAKKNASPTWSPTSKVTSPGMNKAVSTKTQAKNIVVAKAENGSPKKTMQKKNTSAGKSAAQSMESTVVNLMPRSTETDKSTYNDPLFIYECTGCKQKFKSTGDVTRHVQFCPDGEVEVPVKRQRTTGKQTGTDVWHMKPIVSSPQARATRSKGADPQSVEWFVASKAKTS